LVNLVPAALERLQSELPTSQVLAVRGDDDELRDWLTAGTVDLSVSTTPIANVASASPVLDELVAVLPAHHNLVEKERIDLVALAATGVVDPGGTCGTILASAFAKSGISWQPNYTVREVSAMISIAAANIAVGIVPAIAAPQPSSCDVVLRPVCPALRRRLYIYYESRHKVAERFAAFLTDIGNQVASRYSEIT
jgi:DNA-binding transcriptional LysR family regulator